MPRPALALAALLLCTPLVADVVSTEYPASAVALRPVNHLPGIAVSATRILTWWQDGIVPPYAVYRADLRPDGTVDVGTRQPLDGTSPLVVPFDGTFLTWWNDPADPSAALAQRLDGGPPRRLANNGRAFLLAWNGTHLLRLGGSPNFPYATILDRNLNVVAQDVPLPGGNGESAVGVAGGFFVISVGSSGTKGIVIDDSGKTHALPAPLSGYQASWIASNGTDALFVWTNDGTRLYAQRYSPAGGPIGDTMVIAATTTTSFTAARVASNGSDFFVAWYDSSTKAVYVRRVGTAPAADTIVVTSDLPTSFPTWSLDGGPAGVFLSWEAASIPMALNRRVDVLTDPHPIELQAPDQSDLVLAGDGTHTMAVWTESPSRAVMGGRLDEGGDPLDGSGFTIAPPGTPAVFSKNSLLYDGVDYLAFWQTSDAALHARFLNRDGTPAPKTLDISPPGAATYGYSVAWTGSQFLAVWPNGVQVDGAFITPNGVVARFQGIAPYTSGGVAIAAGPRPLLVTSTSTGVVGRFLDDNSTFPIDSLPGTPRAVSSGRDYLVTWTRSTSLSQTTIASEAWAARVDASGHFVGAPMQVATQTAVNGATVAAGIPLFDGTNYRIVYHASGVTSEAVLDDAAFRCSCVDALVVSADPAAGFPSATAAMGRTAIGYPRLLSGPVLGGLHVRAVVRYVLPGTAARRRATH